VRAAAGAVAVTALLLTGCTSEQRPAPYTVDEADARTALAAVLQQERSYVQRTGSTAGFGAAATVPRTPLALDLTDTWAAVTLTDGRCVTADLGSRAVRTGPCPLADDPPD
jgi:hypothetical protein